MALTTGLSLICQVWTGGVKKLWLVDKADVSTMTLTGGQYTAITMVSGKVFKLFEFDDDSCEWKESSNRNPDSGSTMIKDTIECMFQGNSNIVRTSLEEIIASSTCGMIGVVEDNNDTKWVIGYGERSKRALKQSTSEQTTGKVYDDFVGTTIMLEVNTLEKARVANITTIPV